MSIFNERNVSVFSQTMPLTVEEPPTVQDAILYAMLKKEPIGKTIIDFQMSGSSSRIAAAREYAKHTYTLGLPGSAITTTGQVSNTDVADAITDNLSLPYGCLVTLNVLKPLWLYDIARPWLDANRGFDPQYGSISIYPGDWQVPFTRWNTYPVHANKPLITDIVIDPADRTSILITYERNMTYYKSWEHYDVPEGDYQKFYTESYTIPTGLQPGKLYCIANYRILDEFAVAADAVNWWFYSVETLAYPDLVPATTDELNSHYPVIPIRYENAFINSVDNPDLYATGKFLLRKLNISFDSTVDTLATNPDIAEIDHAYIMFGIDLQRDDDTANKYLIEFFHYLSTANNSTVYDALVDVEGEEDRYNAKWGITASVNDSPLSSYTYSLDGGVTQISVVNPTDMLSITEHGLDIQLRYDFITSVIETGSIGAIDTLTREYVIEEIPVAGVAPKKYRSSMRLKQQLTTNTYRHVYVYGVSQVNKIYEEHSITTRPKDIIDDPTNHNFVIPLHHAVMRRIPLTDRNSLYDASLFMVINGYTDEHVDWYETSIFRMVINIVAMVATMLTLQTWLGVGIIVSTLGVNAVLLYILSLIIIVGAFQVGVDALSKKLGPDVATGIALTILAIGIANVTGYAPVGIAAIPADAFMYTGSAFIKGSQAAMNELISDVNTEYSEFMIDSAAKMELLEAKAALLETDYTLPFSYLEDPLYYKPDIKTKPERFYDKIHVGNIGVLSLDMVESYVERALILPEGINQE